jgi:voltage-gated potassium channel
MKNIKKKLYTIIFEAETTGGRVFDILLILAVMASTVCVSLESVAGIKARYGAELVVAEWFFTLLFTAEYITRIIVFRRPLSYVFSFFGLVDLVSIIPTYLSLLFPGAQMLMAVRVLRLLRVFRVLKLTRYTTATLLLMSAIRESRPKIIVFLWGVLSTVIIVGAVIYLIEGPEHGFTSIPTSIYWAVVTMTTVGYGDLVPGTPWGKFLASFMMVAGYALIAVPTGIMTVELSNLSKTEDFTRCCPYCAKEGHESSAKFCSACGKTLGE